SDGVNSTTLTFHTTSEGTRLQFWLPAQPKSHPVRTGDAFLFMILTYTDPNQPGTNFGFDPELLTLRLPNGTTVQARNISTKSDRLLNVFEVPASFTTGTVIVSGSEQSNGLTFSVPSAVSFPVSISAG
ncbi:MAG: hypothetical protein QOG80_275, partial [Pseudonocardiales bacterium]|nr:hypothetical protein [Pseudonocardiales bacterium]